MNAWQQDHKILIWAAALQLLAGRSMATLSPLFDPIDLGQDAASLSDILNGDQLPPADKRKTYFAKCSMQIPGIRILQIRAIQDHSGRAR